MRRAHLARTRISDYHKRIQECEKRKKEHISYLQKLKDKAVDRELLYEEYKRIIDEMHNGRTISTWIEYYESYASECWKRIKEEEKAIRRNNFLMVTSSIFIVSILILFVLYGAPAILGFITKKSVETELFLESINFTASDSTNFDWQPENLGQLKSLKVSGIIAGSGNIKVYLDDLLVLDSSRISFQQVTETTSSEHGNNLITGFSIENSSLSEQSENPSPLTKATPQGEISSNTRAGASEEREVGPSQEEPLPETNESVKAIINNTFVNESILNKTRFNETNQTQVIPESNETIIQPTPHISNKFQFTNICEETCNLSGHSLNKTSYKIKIEIENASLFLEKINYEIIRGKTKEEKIEKKADLKNLILEKKEKLGKSDILTYKEKIMIKKKVKWKKRIDTISAENLSLQIPNLAENITLYKIKKSIEKEDILSQENTEKNSLDIEIKDESEAYEIEYETPAPEVQEEDFERGRKIVHVSAPDELNYTNVLTFTNISEIIKVGEENKIKLKWIENKSLVDFVALDSDNNSLIDYIEWVVPHLSNQTFEIILITKAEHLGNNREFISDIYEEVKALDELWSEAILDGQHVRVTFERNLTFERDITIYPRIIDGNPRIEVYEIDGNEIIAEFESLRNNEYNKVFLTNLIEEQDNFDLRILNGNIEINHIIDPGTLVIGSSVILCGEVNSYDTIYVNASGVLQICAFNGTAGTGYVNISLGAIGNFTVASGGLVNGIGAGGGGGAGSTSTSACSTQGGDGNTSTAGTTSCSANGGGGSGAQRPDAGASIGGGGGGFGAVGGKGGVSSTGTQSVGGNAYENSGSTALKMGSGGGGESGDAPYSGSAGGGGFKVNASSGVINIFGTINVSGVKGTDGDKTDDSGGGGGSGGHVILIARNLTLDNGIIQASGGGGGDGISGGGGSDSCGGGGGSGGRIVYVYNKTSQTGLTNITSGGAKGVGIDPDCDQDSDAGTSTAGSAGSVSYASTTFPDIDVEAPRFSNFWDNNATLIDSGTAYFNATIISTNGTVKLEINGVNYTASNTTATEFNVSISMASSGTFAYYWLSWGNGTSNLYNVSSNRYYTVNGIYPNVTLNSPADGANLTYTNVTFNCTSYDNSNLNNVTLYFNSSTGGAQGGIAQVQNKTGIVTSATNTITCTLNSAATANNLLVTAVGSDKNAGTYTAPPGFTIINTTSATSVSGALAYKVATGGETAIQWNQSTTSGTGGVACWVGEYSGLATSDVLDVGAENETSTSADSIKTSLDTGITATTAQADELAIAIMAADTMISVDAGRAWSNGFSEAGFADTGVSGGTGLSIANKTLSSTGQQSSVYSTTDIGDQMYTAIATFKAATTGGIAWHANETKNISGTQNETIFQKNLTDNSSYSWNCLVYDAAENLNWSTSNFTFTISVPTDNPPLVTLTSPSNASTSTALAINFNFTASDDTNLTNATLYFCNVTNTTIQVNKTVYFRDNGATINRTDDTYLSENNTGLINGSATAFNIDGDDPSGSGQNLNALIIFPNIFGNANDQIPSGSTIINATLTLNVIDVGSSIVFFRLKTNWSESEANWTSNFSGSGWLSLGAYPNDVDTGYNVTGTGSLGSNVYTITNFVQNWSNGLSNYGLLIYPTGIDGIDISSSEASSNKPLLSVTYQSTQDGQQCNSSFSANKTITISGTSNSTNITQTMQDNQTYWWNIYVCDSANQCVFNNTNYTLILNTSFTDTTPPQVTIEAPASRAYGSKFINFNVTLNENGDSCLYSLNSGQTNVTMTKANSTKFGARNSSIGDGNYNVRFYCNDTSGNLNATTSRAFNISHNQKRFIVIGIDGMQWNHYRDVLNSRMTNFTRMMNNYGGWNGTANITGHGLTETKPGNAEIHSGLNSTLTAITSNSDGNVLPNSNSTFERLETWNSSIVTGSIYGKTAAYVPHILLDNAYQNVDWWQNRSSYNPTAWSDGTACDYSTNVSTKAKEFLGNYSNSSFYLFMYWGVPDCSGHAAGDNSANYNNSFTDVDNALGILLDKLIEEGIDDNTQILITADHGWNEGTTGHSTANSDTITLPLITNNASLTAAYGNNDNIREQCELAPTLLDYFEIPSSNWSDMTGNGCGSMINTTGGNTAPQITFVTNISLDNTINPAEDTFVNITFNFTAWDADGAINLNETTARANFTGSGLPVRQNLTCIRINTYGDPVNYANFTCIIHMWYFDPSGTWNISVSINDTSNSVAINSTFNFTYNTLTAFKMAPTSVTFASINPGATNTTSNNDPILLNNTGNVNIAAGAIQVNATDLLGETDNTRGIYAGNITVANNTLPASAECDFTGNNNASLMLASKFSVVNLTSLSRGNNSLNYANETSGQEQLFFCILKAGNELSAQSYSTDNKGAWTIKIAVVAISIKLLRRKRRKLLKEIEPIINKIEYLARKHDIERNEVMRLVELQQHFIPISIFKKEIGGLEVVCRYLRDNLGMTFHEIALVLERDDRTIWTAYYKGKKKVSGSLKVGDSQIGIPISILRNRAFTVLESIIIYLKERNMGYVEIAHLLHRDQRNIWTIYSRAIKKQQRIL